MEALTLPEMKPVTSSNLFAIGYDAANQMLYVQFAKHVVQDGARITVGGSVYCYAGVPQQEFDDLLVVDDKVRAALAENKSPAESVAGHFNLRIKGSSSSPNYPYKKVS